MWKLRLLVLCGIVAANLAAWAGIIWLGATIVKHVWGG